MQGEGEELLTVSRYNCRRSTSRPGFYKNELQYNDDAQCVEGDRDEPQQQLKHKVGNLEQRREQYQRH